MVRILVSKYRYFYIIFGVVVEVLLIPFGVANIKLFSVLSHWETGGFIRQNALLLVSGRACTKCEGYKTVIQFHDQAFLKKSVIKVIS